MRMRLRRICWVPGLAIALALANAQGDATAGKIALPPPVPYLNAREDFFMGNGYAGAGGPGDGSWNFLVGPDYTCPNYLRREEIRLVVDGAEQKLRMDVHRARKTGVFYGTSANGDLKITLVDYALMGQPCVARFIQIENLSGRQKHAVSVRAYIQPITGPGRSHEISGLINNKRHWLQLKLDSSLKCCEGRYCQNWSDRYATIFFDKAVNTVTRANGGCVFTTAPETMAPHACSDCVLYHYMDYTNFGGVSWLEKHEPQDPAQDLAQCIAGWRKWFDGVAPKYSLDQIKDARARDLVEGGLATIKMNECRDGGIVANERGWDMSYVRDAYCGLRALTAFGHFDESRRFIQWLDKQYRAHGLIPDAGPGGSLIYAHPNGNNGRVCPEANAVVEVTALCILAARDYYQGTHDLRALARADDSLSYSLDAQLKYAMTNQDRLEFSGDETELCGASDVAG
ncbi:MAG: hypothetical protein ACRED1_10280, partial [Limisphaerales bacterium]